MKSVQPQVKLINYSPDAGQLLAAAARLCYASSDAAPLDQDLASVADFVKKLREMGHLSPLEHAVFTFHIEGVSRAMTHQLVRHRLASYSQRSQRYVPHADFDYVMPPQLEGRTVDDDGRSVPADAYFAETMQLIAERYRKLNAALGQTGERSNEDARYVLPNACETSIMMTMNARELLHFLEERLCLRAQWEIRDVANIILDLVRPVLAPVFDGAGPKCTRLGGCPEGKFTCGRYADIKQRYAGDRPAAP